MADEKIEVEWIGTAQRMLQVIERVDSRLNTQEKTLQKLSDTGKKGGEAVAGSFNKLEQMLRKNEAALKDMVIGSKEFDTQRLKVDKLREAHDRMKASLTGKNGAKTGALIPDQKGSLADIDRQLKNVEAQLKRTAASSSEFKKLETVYAGLKKRHDEMSAALKKLGTEAPKVAIDAAGSFNRLEKELLENEQALKKLVIGSKAFGEQKAKVEELRKTLQGAKSQLATTAESTGGLLSTGLGKMAALAASMLSFQAIVSAVVAELEKTKQLKLDAAATTRTFEQALADVGQNIGGGAIPQAKKMILENAPKLGTTNEGLADLLGVAISAGAKDLTEAMSLVAATLKLTVGDAQKARALVGGTLDVASLGGSQNFEGALGQLLQTQSQVRSTNLAEFSSNIGPGLAAATADLSQQKGVSTERALEISSVISQIIKDQTGSNTATTMRMLFTRMGSFVPELEKKLDDGGLAKVTSEQITAFQTLKTFDDRLRMMQDVPAIGQQFLETQRESIGKTAIAEIIGKSARAVLFEEKAKQNISSIDAAQGFFGDLNKSLVGETAQLTAERKAQANIAASEVIGTRDLQGTVIKIVEDAVAKVNLSGLDVETAGTIRNRLRLGDATGANPIDTGITALREAQHRRKAFGFIPAGG